MAKRFTDITKWDKPWFRKLSPTQKLVFLYILDKCDRAGFWEIDLDRMAFDMGLTSPLEDPCKPLGSSLEAPWMGLKDIIVRSGWLLVRDFVAFQVPGGLNCNNRAHGGIITSLLKRVELFPEAKTHLKGLPSPFQGAKETETETEEETEEETDKDKNKKPRPRFVKPTIEEVAEYMKSRGKGVDPQEYYDHYESNGWKVGRNSMKDWKAAARKWESSGYGKSGSGKRQGNLREGATSEPGKFAGLAERQRAEALSGMQGDGLPVDDVPVEGDGGDTEGTGAVGGGAV